VGRHQLPGGSVTLGWKKHNKKILGEIKKKREKPKGSHPVENTSIKGGRQTKLYGHFYPKRETKPKFRCVGNDNKSVEKFLEISDTYVLPVQSGAKKTVRRQTVIP